MLRPEQNPFSKPPKAPLKPERELVEAYLGKEAAGLLEDEPKPLDDMGLGPIEKLSNEEKDAIRKERENRLWTKRQYYDWAKEYLGKDEGWVNKTFTFHPDGTTSVDGHLDCRSLTEPILPKGLKLVGRHLYLSDLTSAEGLTLPQSVGGSLDLRRLTSAEGLTLPKSVGGGLYLDSLTSAQGLTLPQSVGGYLDLNSLASVEGLTLPQSVGGELDLDGLSAGEKAKIRKERPDLRIVQELYAPPRI